jgi:ABC-type transport system involved in multi-copper enzyme maturation permease subunit
MVSIMFVTLVGIFRDRVFRGIMCACLVLLFVPTISSLSMRQVTELAITFSLSFISFLLLLLAVFLGSTAIWKDMERRYTFSVLSFPTGRASYLLGKFFGIAVFLVLIAAIVGAVSCLVIASASTIYPSLKAIIWSNVALAIMFSAMKYVLLVACTFLFSVFSTSMFLPLFGTISIFMAGNASQQVYEYITSPVAVKTTSPFVISIAKFLYYVIPNFSVFDLSVYAVYAIVPDGKQLMLTALYFVVYTSLLLLLSLVVFAKREMI